MYSKKSIVINEKELIPNPFRSEKVMQSFIIEHLDCLKIDGIDEDIVFLDEEFSINSNNQDDNKRFRSDILVQYGQNRIAIVENKKDIINQATIDQVTRYLSHKSNIFEQLKQKELIEKDGNIEDYSFIGIVCGNSIEEPVLTAIRNGNTNNEYIGAVILNRYFDEKNNSLVFLDSYFPTKNINQRDFQKYNFNGKIYGKGRLVLAVIQEYVSSKNYKVTYNELEKIFPNSIRSGGVFCELSIALSKRTKREFTKPTEIIKLSDCEIAVSNQWGIGNIDKFVSSAVKMGYRIN